jgi:hypothetical protein
MQWRLVIVDKPLIPNTEGNRKSQRAGKAGAGEVHDAVGDQATALERGTE